MESSSPPNPPDDAIDEDITKLEAQIETNKKTLSSIQEQLNTLEVVSKEDKTVKIMLKLKNLIKNSETNDNSEKFQKIVENIKEETIQDVKNMNKK